jgi:hypothetical protein
MGKGHIVWMPRRTKAFEIMKAMMIRDCLLRYPDHNKPFQIYADASDYQLHLPPIKMSSKLPLLMATTKERKHIQTNSLT